MKILKLITTTLLMLLIFGVGSALNAQNRMNNRNSVYLIKRLETNTDQFRDDLNVDFDNAKNEKMRETLLEARVASFEYVTDKLRDRVEDNEEVPFDIEDVLSRALAIEQGLQKAEISAEARADWMRVKSNLDDLAKAYNITWIWTLESNPYWTNPSAAESIVDRLESRTDEFRRSFDYGLDTSSLNGTAAETNAVKLADDFEEQVDRWEDLADNERLSQANVNLLLNRALALEVFMRANNLTTTRAYRDWNRVKANLDELAMMAKIEWRWSGTPVKTS